ncbi:RNA polymerase I-specific transcription initiation factor RRN3 [Agrocybe pediades]|nr:RNA polymerase I-specific transcription initiation factor RRN3 [Agrocybe pediades]
MDPHSRRSQFNQRAPKSGPPSRNADIISTHKPEPKMPLKKTSTSSSETSLLIRRPIATNSRVKQDEIFKRDMYLSFVTNALQQKANGISDSFDELVSQFSIPSSSSSSSVQQPPQVDTAQIRLWLSALSHVVSRLERTHSSLVDAIMNMPWTTFDSATVKSYTVFTGMLLSARPEYLSLVLTKIAHGFTYQSGLQALDSSMPSTSSAPMTRRVIYDRLHYLLRHILTLVPTLPSTLQPLLIRHFPHKRQNQVAQTTYIRNLLRVSTYCPELADKILATIVDRAIQIDVEIQIELEELEEEEESADEEDVFELDPFDVVLGQEPASTSDESDSDDGDTFSDLSSDAGDLDDYDLQRHTEIPTNVKHIQEMVKKLDAILMLLFEHFSRSRAVDTVTAAPHQISPSKLPPLPPLEAEYLTPIEWPASSAQAFNFSPSDALSIATASQVVPDDNVKPLASTTTDKHPDTNTTLRSQFHSLLSIFDRTILRTFKSRYTQFLIFWYASLDPEFADIFQGMLVERALISSTTDVPSSLGSSEAGSNTSRAHVMAPELTRAAAASYIGSFVSRATFVDREGARRVVSVLCDYLKTHLDTVDLDLRTSLGIGSRNTRASTANAAAVVGAILASGQHTVFYAITQAIFLIFCFRWRDLGDDVDLEFDEFGLSGGGGKAAQSAASGKGKWMPELSEVKRAVASILNPLKVCSPNVVMQFARVSQATDFLYCYPWLEMNKRGDLSLTMGSSTSRRSTGGADGADAVTLSNTKILYEPVNAELNTFFPFDPYRLPKSNVFIQGVYREWSSVAIDDEDDDEDEEDEEEDDEGELPDDSSSLYAGDNSYRGYTARLDIPKDKTQARSGTNDDDGGLGASLGAMSISPAGMAISVSMG